MSFDINCDECRNSIGKDDFIVCEKCYSDLQKEIERLNEIISEMEVKQ